MPLEIKGHFIINTDALWYLLCKVSYRVIAADILHDLAYELNVVEVLALLDERNILHTILRKYS